MTIGVGLIGALAAGTYLMRLAGLALVHRRLPELLTRLLPLIPAALFAGLVVTNGFATDGELHFDERAGGIVVAVLLAYWRRSLGTVVIGGVAATALLRLVGSATFV